jgi:ABC-type sugar transport system ATPase subunit
MLRCRGISKSYPGVKSLDDVGIDVEAGSIHALLGENGAGKSTLVRIIAGAATPDAGVVSLEGTDVKWTSTKEARQAGIHVIHQELVLFPDLSVAENIFIGEEPRTAFGTIDHRAMRRKAAEILAELGANIDVAKPVGHLAIADQQMVEIAKAFIGRVKLLILDEPTAVISGREVDLLFDRLRKLRSQGVAIMYISHRLEEVFELADRFTVLKDGRFVDTGAVADIDRHSLITMMVGRELQDLYPAKRKADDSSAVIVDVESLGDGLRAKSASFQIRRGEVLGLAGMVGSGRTEVAELIFGARAKVSGTIRLDGKLVERLSPRRSIERGVGFLTEDRKGEGLVLNLSVATNISLVRMGEVSSGGVLNKVAELNRADQDIRNLGIAGARPETPTINLSGGNQQKVLFARWMAVSDSLLILDEPTRGVDVGSKAELYRLIRICADRGAAILLISSEMQEIIGMSDRVVVMRAGHTVGELAGSDITERAILELATGR